MASIGEGRIDHRLGRFANCGYGGSRDHAENKPSADKLICPLHIVPKFRRAQPLVDTLSHSIDITHLNLSTAVKLLRTGRHSRCAKLRYKALCVRPVLLSTAGFRPPQVSACLKAFHAAAAIEL